MESNINTYRLNQGKKEYIFTTSVVGDQLRMSCKNSSNENNKKYTRDFTIEQLHQIDELFRFIKTATQASEYIDKALGKQKVRVSEENGFLKIIFYINTNGITNQIDIPLGSSDSTILESNGNQYLQEGNILNYGSSNYFGEQVGGQDNNLDSLLNSAYAQNGQIITSDVKDTNQYFSQFDNYSNENNYNQNQIFESNNYYGNPPIIGKVNDSYDKYFQAYQSDNGFQDTQNYSNNEQLTQNYELNEYGQAYQNIETINNNQVQGFESKPYIGPVENEQVNVNYDEQINQYLQQQNINSTTEIEQTQNQQDIENSYKELTTTKVLPIQTSTRVLPPLGPFTSLQGVDLHGLASVNAQKNSNIAFQPVQATQTENNYYEELSVKSEPIISEDKTKTLSSNINTNSATNISNIKITKPTVTKKQLSEKKYKQGELEEIQILRTQLAELEPLRKKVAEMEVLRGQLSELNSLRAQVAEYNAVKSQFKEINELRAQVEQLSLENEKLKIKVEELEDLNLKYEEEIKNLKENERLYSMKSKASNTENKDIIYEESSQDMAVKGDIIHDTQELDLITNKINQSNQKLTLNLLYKATADSDKAAAFHAKCDDAKSTIVLVETDKGKRFGGYTTLSWAGDCIDKKDEEAFVFSLDKMKTYDNIPGEEAIGCYPKFGPIFLGCQIRIYDNAFTKGGTTFERGLNFDTQEDFELTDGDRVFNVKEIEVYEVIKE